MSIEVATLRPDAMSDFGGNWTVTGGIFPHTVLADDSLSTYVSMLGTGSFFAVTFGDLTLPAGWEVNRCRLRVQAASTDPSQVQYRQEFSSSIANPTITNSTNFLIQTFTETWRSSPPGGGTWSDSDVDDLEARLNHVVFHPDGKVYAVYLDVEIEGSGEIIGGEGFGLIPML